ncbi:hypothetical protein H257_03259 [Aphanomyces astaci]|uniref:Uncharacterized protein n=1 Tax=Aphanomyces astaci TaxID=112090 RepID=W4H1W6_APHAT|nr:hypothetical protein H257_03259 [Aphanomyces astaci]ETV85551.1 hypothetical protein H257_03259 [Aphanomyces astaci]|eukprot:XP_009825569.1 hypothetical protein H257_03259 [Aphanomyces astaci]
MCAASVVYHREWFLDTLPQHHALFSTVLFWNVDLHRLAPNLEVMRNELQSTHDKLQTAHSELPTDLATEATKNMYAQWKYLMRRMEDIFDAETGAKPMTTTVQLIATSPSSLMWSFACLVHN